MPAKARWSGSTERASGDPAAPAGAGPIQRRHEPIDSSSAPPSIAAPAMVWGNVASRTGLVISSPKLVSWARPVTGSSP